MMQVLRQIFDSASDVSYSTAAGKRKVRFASSFDDSSDAASEKLALADSFVETLLEAGNYATINRSIFQHYHIYLI